MYRILLRSLAKTREGGGVAYCTLVTWAVLAEIGSVMFPVRQYDDRSLSRTGSCPHYQTRHSR